MSEIHTSEIVANIWRSVALPEYEGVPLIVTGRGEAYLIVLEDE